MGSPDAKKKIEIRHETRDGIQVFFMQGAIEIDQVPEAKEQLAQAFEEKSPRMVLDLTEVQYLDSAGIGLLIGTLRRATQDGGGLKLAGLSSYLTGIFSIINLGNIFDLHPDLDSALAAFQS